MGKSKQTPNKAKNNQTRRRYRPGREALREIRSFRRPRRNIIERYPFQEVVRQITRGNGFQHRFQSTALDALLEGFEAFIVYWFEEARVAAYYLRHNKNRTPLLKVIRLESAMRGFTRRAKPLLENETNEKL